MIDPHIKDIQIDKGSIDKKKGLGILLYIFLGYLCLYLFTAPARLPSGDDLVMLQVADRISQHGFSRIPGLDNKETYSKYGLGQSLIDIPITWAYRNAMAILDTNALEGGDIQRLFKFLLVVGSLPAFLGASLNVVFFLTCRRLGYGLKTSFLSTLILGLTTITWVYSQTIFSDPTLGLLWMLALYALLSYRASPKSIWAAIAGGAVGFSVITKIVSIYTIPIFAGYLFYLILSNHRKTASNHKKGKTLGNIVMPSLSFLTPLIASVAVILWYNHIRYGALFDFGYDDGRDSIFGFNTPFLTGLYGLLFSPGKGFFFYSPSAILASLGANRLYRRHKIETIVIIGIICGLILIYSKWWAWHGDWSWGPRFLSCLPPFFILLGVGWLDDALSRLKTRQPRSRLRVGFLSLLLAISIMIQIPGLCINSENYIIFVVNHAHISNGGFYHEESWPIRDDSLQLHFIPDFSPIAGHIWMMRCLYRRGDAKLDTILINPPWRKLNPLWVPNKIDWSLFRYRIWWLYAKQEGFLGAGKMLLVASLLSLTSLGSFGMGLRLVRRS